MLIACEITNGVVVLFFSKLEQEQQSGKNFENVLILKQNNVREKSVAQIKLTLNFQIQCMVLRKT